MRPIRLVQKIHKWMALLIGVQLFIWSVSGFYMVVVDLDIIHGDHLVKPNPRLTVDAVSSASDEIADLVKDNVDIQSILIRQVEDRVVLEVSTNNANFRIDATTGERLQPPRADEIVKLAKSYYAGDGSLSKAKLLTSEPPTEIGARPLPLWRIDFDDAWDTSFYLSADNGELLTRRHTLWRVFDFFWMLHIMDYDAREDVNNVLLRFASLTALVLVLTGIWYLYLRIRLGGRRSDST